MARFLFFTFISLFLLVSISSTVQSQSNGLNIMSYNIRYDNPDDAPNHWDNRKERVANVIKFYRPAFVGTQEGLIHQLTYLDQELSNYEWIGQGRKDGKHGGEFSAIFYDKRKVKLVEESDSTVWLSETPQKPSKSWMPPCPAYSPGDYLKSNLLVSKFLFSIPILIMSEKSPALKAQNLF